MTSAQITDDTTGLVRKENEEENGTGRKKKCLQDPILERMNNHYKDKRKEDYILTIS